MRGGAGTLARAVLLSGLYFAQGLPFGIFTQAVPVMMREEGYSLGSIGLSNLLALPWVLKFVWAPFVDRVPGPRKRVILGLNLLAAALLGGLSGVPPGELVPLMIGVLLCNAVAATQDIATDALAVELLPPSERGLGNGIQVAGYRLGMVVGGGVLLQNFDRLGWTGTFLVAAGIVLLASLPIALSAPVPRVDRPAAVPDDALRWDRWFVGADGRAWFALLFFYKFGDSFGTAMVKPLLVDQKFSLAEIGELAGVYGSAASIVGALLGGAFVSRRGLREGVLTFGVGQVLVVAGLAFLAHEGPHWAVHAMVAEHLVSGMATAALFAAMMGACRPGHSGTDYSVQASIVVLAQGLGALASGFSAGWLGYVAHFLLAAALCLFAVAMVLRVSSRPGRFSFSPPAG